MRRCRDRRLESGTAGCAQQPCEREGSRCSEHEVKGRRSKPHKATDCRYGHAPKGCETTCSRCRSARESKRRALQDRRFCRFSGESVRGKCGNREPRSCEKRRRRKKPITESLSSGVTAEEHGPAWTGHFRRLRFQVIHVSTDEPKLPPLPIQGWVIMVQENPRIPSKSVKSNQPKSHVPHPFPFLDTTIG